ncbi:hypothetical protein V5O48_003686 [Marasmius crinis-equi]|uniref:Uncharacterized protein n=1 Tax=Marasmius crinis-equi TaxID=585013 RepID=A0ABR3FS66_9AGAR
MATVQSKMQATAPVAPARSSLRQAMQKIAACFPHTAAVAKPNDLTVQSLHVFLEDVALRRHLNPNPELHNSDPDLESACIRVESELELALEMSRKGDEGGRTGSNGIRVRKQGPEESSCSSEKRRKRTTSAEGDSHPRKRRKKAKSKNKNEVNDTKDQFLIKLPPVEWRLRREGSIEPGEIIGVDFSSIPQDVRGKDRKKARQVLRKDVMDDARQGQETAVPVIGFQNVLQDARIASTGWQGVNAPADERNEIRELVQGGHKLLNIRPIPYNGQVLPPYSLPLANHSSRKRLFVADGNGYTLIFRSHITEHMLKTLLPLVNKTARLFMTEVKPPSDEDMRKNLRGRHFFCTAGHDRNNKEKPALSQWHQANAAALERFFAEGQPLEELTRYGCKIVRRVFPAIVKRFEACAKKIGIQPLYGGLFFNFCLNGVRMDAPNPVPRVFCEPHIDFKNLALAICMVFVYGHFNHHEKCWIVIWEAGVALELPMGVFVLYPSSLFLHFNVDAANLNIVATDGEKPTKENSKSLNCLCGNTQSDHDESWKNADGRGSMVWFNQSSMFQTTELGYNTVAQARAAGAETTCNVDEWLEKGIFPTVSLDE